MYKSIALAFAIGFSPLSQAVDYQPGPLAKRQSGVPKGKVIKQNGLNANIFPALSAITGFISQLSMMAKNKLT